MAVNIQNENVRDLAAIYRRHEQFTYSTQKPEKNTEGLFFFPNCKSYRDKERGWRRVNDDRFTQSSTKVDDKGKFNYTQASKAIDDSHEFFRRNYRCSEYGELALIHYLVVPSAVPVQPRDHGHQSSRRVMLTTNPKVKNGNKQALAPPTQEADSSIDETLAYSLLQCNEIPELLEEPSTEEGKTWYKAWKAQKEINSSNHKLFTKIFNSLKDSRTTQSVMVTEQTPEKHKKVVLGTERGKASAMKPQTLSVFNMYQGKKTVFEKGEAEHKASAKGRGYKNVMGTVEAGQSSSSKEPLRENVVQPKIHKNRSRRPHRDKATETEPKTTTASDTVRSSKS